MGIPPPRMPWWYPLSLMKAVIKFTSALPAQFLMAGLANYVDFEMNSLQFDVEKYATFTIQHTNFRSVLFAAVDLPSAPSNSRGKRSLSLHASHQRHSIKRAEHLFKEKFLEIVITSGPISLVQIASAENETENIVNLPSGMHIAVSCHFSAGCVTLKDVDANTMIETVKLNTNHLLELLKSIKQSLPPKSAPVPDQNLEKPPKTVKLLHSASLSIRDTIIETKHAEDCFSTLNIKDMCLTGIVENEVLGIDPYLKALYTTKLVSWTITDNSIAITKRRLTEVIVIPSIAFNATISQSVIAKKKYDQMDTLPETFIGILEGDDLIPNKQFVNLSINVDHPKIFLDISKISTFKKLSSNLQRRQNALQAPSASPRNSKEFYNLPRASLAITVEYPSIYFRSLEKSVGLISWSELNFDVSGAYFVERNRPTSIISNFSEPNISAVDHTNLAENEEKIEYHVDSSTIQKLHSPTRPSWTNLFRRSWRPKEADGEHKKSNSLGWRYKASSRFIMQHTCLDAIAKKEGEKPLILIKDIELSVKANFNVTFFNEEDTLHQQVKSSWDPYEQHHDVRITVDKTVLNLYSETETGTSQLDFWVNNIANEIKSNWPSKTKNPSNTKNQRIYQHILTTRIQFELNNSSLILKGLDQGLKGKRPVPEGYIDNAPEEDINACLVLSLDYFSVLFNGSRVSIANRQMHRYSANVGSVNNAEAENDGKENGHALLGSIRVSLQEMAVKRMFGNKIDSWQENNDKQFMVLWIPHVNIRTNMTKTSDHILLSPSIVVKKIGIQYTISNHYALLITVLSTKQFVQKVIKKEDTRIREKKPSSVVFSKLQLQANRTDVHVSLPDTTKLYVRMDSLRTEWLNDIEHRGEMPSTAIRNLTVYGVAPEEERQWEQLLEIDNLQLSIEKDMDLATGVLSKVYQLSLSKFYLRIPYKYELCHVLDNAVNLMKVIKASHSRLLKGVSFLYFGPTEKKEPISIPDMRLICDLFTFQLEDDPFEVRLRSIWKTGIVEQANRVALQDAFDLKAKTLTTHQFSETSEENKNTDIKYDARVHEALRGLQEHNSKSWKRHIDTAISKEKSAYEKIRTADYRSSILPDQLGNVLGNDEGINEDYANIFYINIVSLPHYSPLLDVTIRNTQLDFRRPDFNLEKTREFIYDLGKGQPLDTPLSTLIPFHLDWKAGATWVQIRDYPLPFVLVPPTSPEKDREQENTYSWSLSGNYALADTLGDLDATRCINLEIVNDPSRDTRYSVQVPRTSTPLKFFSTVNISVHTPGLSYICWCIPYQPAIQDISRIFETFTKPPIDPSEKVGFWDKIRLIIHTRTKISFAGGGDLAVIMKGSRNPYEMSEKGFGLAKLWRNNVVWLIGYDNPEGEFMQVTSCDYAFGVPDPVHGGFSAPYILPVATHQPDSYPSSASVSSLDSASFTKENKDNFCFTKVALKMTGGIRMGLGCQLERACNCDLCDENSDVSTDDREAHKRTLLEFSPHYKVKMKTPDNVHEEDYDAYRGFRSDFIHFSISIVKLTVPESEKEITNVIGNSMHITPGFLDHFVSWVRLFGGAMSYPLRSGPLFPKLDTRPTKKFGKHMSTLKYKIVINPLTIGCFVKDENVEAENVAVQELGDSVGLKGFVKGFSLDIHQRREIVNISNYKLDQKRLKANWPIQEAEIQLKNIDIRAVKAQYKAMDDKETHAADSISSSIEISNDSDIVASSDGEDVPDMMEGLNYQCGNDPESSEWIDLDDFVELNVDTPTILPSVQVLPFAFSPYFHYIRQTNRDDLQKFKYLHETHDCIFGTAVRKQILIFKFENIKHVYIRTK
ncbi:hypothetical protein G6F23_001619 [Rhizopus arrhizus]|nr:hypothetical protein G6F23_001619 [Rhizopus arrhizus]